MTEDFHRNLRLLSDHYKSIAEVCRRLGVNRSQYNKYLSGRSLPSRHVLKRICDFFGVEEHEILLPHPRFAEMLRIKPPDTDGAPDGRPYLKSLDRLFARSRTDLADYEGVYFEYSYSMTYPGMVLRSLFRLSAATGVAQYQRVENMAPRGQRRYSVRCKYRGLAFYLNDRIFLVDYESVTGNEISHTVLYPNYQSRVTRLSGLKLGVSSGHRREPLCARIVLDPVDPATGLKAALRRCGLLEPDDPDIAPDIKASIANTMDDGAHHFRVVAN